MQTLLRRLFGLNTIDLQRVAETLAAAILDDYSDTLAALDPTSTVQFLRTQYMRLVARYGLPADACNEVANRAWSLIAKARGIEDAATSGKFAFYD